MPQRKRPAMRPRATTQQERALVAQIVATNPALAGQPTEVCRLAGIDVKRKGTVYAWIQAMSLDPEAVQRARADGAARVQAAAADTLVGLLDNLKTAGNRLAESGDSAAAVHNLAGAITYVSKVIAPAAPQPVEQPIPQPPVTINNLVHQGAAPADANPLRGRLNGQPADRPADRASPGPRAN